MQTSLSMPTTLDFSPPIEVSTLTNSRGKKILVTRDDRLPGGTKQRACAPLLQSLMKQGHRRFVYASPFSGFAQVALAYVCSILQVQCVLVCEKDQRFPTEKRLHPFSQQAQDYGAEVILVGDLTEAELMASQLNLKDDSLYKIPLGFDCEEFTLHLSQELKKAWDIINRCQKIKTLWLPVGSGTLTRSFLAILPDGIKVKCLNVHVLPETDHRITSLKADKRVDLLQAPMKFHDPALVLPEIPSNLFYDAKIWHLLEQEAQDGDLWWNVAK